MSNLFFGRIKPIILLSFFVDATNAFAQKNTNTWEPAILKVEALDKKIGQYKKI